MQFHQETHSLDDVRGIVERFETLACHLRPNDVMMVETHLAAGLETSSGRLADVMEQSCQTPDQVGIMAPSLLQLDRLVDDRERMLVDVLVTMMFVRFQTQRGQFGQDNAGDSCVNQQHETLTGGVGK